MRRSGSRTLLLLGAVVALGVALVVFLLMNGGGNTSAQAQPTPTPVIIKVVAPKEDIKQFTILTTDNLGLVDVDQRSVPTTTLNLVNQESVGKMVLRDYRANEPINTNDLQDPGVPQLLEKGKRAFALSIQEINTFNQSIIANDNIDLIWSRKFTVSAYLVPPGGGTAEKVERELWSTKTLLQNIKVLRVQSLRVAANTGGTTNGVNAQAQSGNNDPQKAQQAVQAAFAKDAPPTMVLVLSVDDQQAEVIKFARENGILDVALRATDDTEPGTTTGITDKTLVDDYKVVVPDLIVK
jgi:Flp pilus assembly protein CpaB